MPRLKMSNTSSEEGEDEEPEAGGVLVSAETLRQLLEDSRRTAMKIVADIAEETRLAKIKKAKRGTEVVARIQNVDYTIFENVFEPQEWFTNDVIDAFGMARCTGTFGLNFTTSSLFVSNSLSLAKSESHYRHSHKTFPAELMYFAVPIHHRSHWALIVVAMPSKAVYFLDSLPDYIETSTRTSYCDTIIQFIRKISPSVLEEKSWKIITNVPCLKQTGGSDCGVYVCFYIHSLLTSRITTNGIDSYLDAVSSSRFDPDEFRLFVKQTIFRDEKAMQSRSDN